jgi:hypothetical protein
LAGTQQTKPAKFAAADFSEQEDCQARIKQEQTNIDAYHSAAERPSVPGVVDEGYWHGKAQRGGLTAPFAAETNPRSSAIREFGAA